MDLTPELPSPWRTALAPLGTYPALLAVSDKVAKARSTGRTVYPAPQDVYRAFALTPLDQVKVVLLGQDPYHGPGQAHGLAFSVPRGEPVPPSLRNIYKELAADLGVSPPRHGNLEAWAQQGVLLLNTVLTVEDGQPASHSRLGWEAVTDDVIRHLSDSTQGLVFVLWGAHAQRKAGWIDARKHLVLKGVHPSPLSASRGFFGSRPFSRINEYLIKQGKTPIDWRLSE